MSLPTNQSEIENLTSENLGLTAENQRLKGIIAASNLATWEWNVVTSNIKYNERWAEILGYTISELEPITLETWVSLTHPDDIKESETRMQDLFDKKVHHFEFDYRMRHKSGTYVWVMDRGNVIEWCEDGKPVIIAGTHSDISHIKKTEEVSIGKQAFIETVLNTINVGIVACDNNGVLTLFNKATQDFHGLPNEPIPSEQWADHYNLYHSDGIAPLKMEEVPLFRTLKNGYVENAEFAVVPKNGISRIFNSSGKHIKDKNGTIHGAVLAMQDITEFKKYENSLKKLNDNLFLLNKQLQSSNRELELLAYIASHDLQEPLRMVSNFLTLLKRKYAGIMDEKANEYIYFAVDGAERMKNIINDLLEFLRAGKVTEKIEKVDTNDIVKNVCSAYRARIEDIHAIINYSDLPEIYTYHTVITKIFKSLISNALKFHKKEQTVQITISATQTETHWNFKVQDNGIGIPPEYFKRIFTLFQKVNNSKEFSGSGIGLAIVDKMVEKLGGTVWVDSTPGVGSSFYFTVQKLNETSNAES